MQATRTRPARAAESVAADPPDPYRAWKQAGLLLLALAWIALGLSGHDPWKFDDATNFGVAWEMDQRSDFVVPRLAGEVYLPHPPLVPVVAALTQSLLSPALEPFNAARIAAGLFLGTLLLFCALAAGELAGRNSRWLPVLILIGSVGLWDRAHVLSGELGLTVGMTTGAAEAGRLLEREGYQVLMHSIQFAIAQYVLALISTFVLALIVDWLAPTFGGSKDFIASLKLIAYSYTAAWLAGVFLLLGMLGYLLTLLATIYSFYAFVLGAPVLGKSSPEKAVPFTLVVVLCAIVLAFLTSFVFSGMTTMAPRMNSGMGLMMR